MNRNPGYYSDRFQETRNEEVGSLRAEDLRDPVGGRSSVSRRMVGGESELNKSGTPSSMDIQNQREVWMQMYREVERTMDQNKYGSS